MLVLRIGTSNDVAGGLPEEQRAWHIASRMLGEASGEPVETILKRAWPTAEIPDHVGRWMDEYHPDVVVLQVSNFWYGHESVPLWLEQFDAQIAQNKRDFETRFAKARVLMAEGQWTAAMDELLEIILRDKAWQDGAARKTYVAILELLTPPKPKADAGVPGKSAGGIELMGKAGAQEDEATALLNSYRRKLSMALN